MDALDSLIVNAREAIQGLEGKIHILQDDLKLARVRLEALEAAASARPAPSAQLAAGVTLKVVGHAGAVADFVRRGGRRPGSISRDWKQVLVLLADSDPSEAGYDYADIQNAAEAVGIDSGLSGIRDRIRIYADETHLVDRIGSKFRVKREVADRFRRELAESGAAKAKSGGPDQPQPEEAKTDGAM